jgi:poly-gamma-glutamate synthesis protein (capsule biosynthesis protein)
MISIFKNKNKILALLLFSATVSILVFAGQRHLLGRQKWEAEESGSVNADTTSSEIHFSNTPSSTPALSAKKEEEEPLRFLFWGDMMLDRNVGRIIEEKGLDHLLENIKLPARYDMVSANLEGAVTEKGKHYPPHNSYDFAFDPSLIGRLYEYGFTFFNIANNHLTDQGRQGVRETEDNLEELGFAYVGCPDGEVGECSGKIINIKGKDVGMAGFSLVYSRIDKEKTADVIKELHNDSDLVVVNVHWGVEYKHNINSIQAEMAHSFVDAGADIVIGHHPHVIQGMEIYKRKPIFYSLGNFIFDQYFSTDTQEGLAVDIEIDKNQFNIKLHPFKARGSQIKFTTDKDKDRILERFISWSNIESDIEDSLQAGRVSIIQN